MNRITSPAVVYRLYQYSDKSAIALAFTPEYGKIKLFIRNAYTKKGAPMCFIPGSLSYFAKETSDLHQFESFSHDSAYYHYIQNPEITMRMHLCFDFYDHLFQFGEVSKVFWSLLTKYTGDNYRSLGLYTVYRLLKEAGMGFSLRCSCGGMYGDIILHRGEMMCEACGDYHRVKQGSIPIGREPAEMFGIFADSAAYRKKEFTPAEEMQLLKIFEKHLYNLCGAGTALKSMGVFVNIYENGGI